MFSKFDHSAIFLSGQALPGKRCTDVACPHCKCSCVLCSVLRQIAQQNLENKWWDLGNLQSPATPPRPAQPLGPLCQLSTRLPQLDYQKFVRRSGFSEEHINVLFEDLQLPTSSIFKILIWPHKTTENGNVFQFSVHIFYKVHKFE